MRTKDTASLAIGNGSTQGFATIARAAAELERDGKVRPFYDLSHEYSNSMPLNPFSAPVSVTYLPTEALAGHRANNEAFSGPLGTQGTEIDALGHFGHVDADGVVRYYGGLTQAEVKPADDAPLRRLGIDQAPPIVTSAVLLDATVLKGRTMTAGEQVTAADIDAMLANQRVRDLLPGDALYIYTGWERKWSADNPDPSRTDYYSHGPGLSRDAAEYIDTKKIVCIGMDVPFIDAVSEGYLQGAAGAPADAPANLPFFAHHYNLTQAGIYQVHNMRLSELASDRVYVSATVILPLRIRGGAHSAVRPVAIGAPHNATENGQPRTDGGIV